MARPTRAELERENRELLNMLHDVYDGLGDFLEGGEEEDEHEDDEEEEEEE